jgi:predicted lipoprotein with Yx(FWY)xxD motif
MEAPMTAFRTRPAMVAGLALAIFVAGCGSSGASQAPAAATQGPGGSVTATTLTIGTATAASVGAFLTGPNGLTLYTKSGDTATSSTCTGGCATSWPPLTHTAGQQVVGGSGVTRTFATLTRTDGSMQVTYNGLPLYYWMQDTKAGDMTGQGVGGFSVAAASGGGAGTPAPTATGRGSY